MPFADLDRSELDSFDGQSTISCEACQSVVHDGGNQAASFLLLDNLSVPLLSCDDHLEQFTSICGITSEETANLLNHRPAGGIRCPSCRLAPFTVAQPMLPIGDGVVGILACPEHGAEMVQRFQTGLHTEQQLTATLNTTSSSSL